ncbi:MAG: Hsp70 family protein [Polyangiales bacterium]
MATYGIDLGTTYCAVSRVDPQRSTEPVPVQFDDGGAFPSLVLLAPGRNGPRAVVGAKARQEYAKLVGRRFEAPTGVHLIRGAKNHIGRVADGGDEQGPPWITEGVEFTATDVSALILRALRRRVEAQNLPAMERVVVTHPQKFRNLQRIATQQAAELAGLHVLGILTEPDAAAWAYEHAQPSNSPRKSVVFDFGGGTLDVVLMETSRDAVGRLTTRVVASNGAACGGLEIDQQITEQLLLRYSKEIGDTLDVGDLRAKARDEFMTHAERIKRRLNTADAAHDPDWREQVKWVEFEGFEEHPPARFAVELGELSDWITGVLERAMETLRGALNKGGWKIHDVDAVRMTGQSSLLVAMRKRIEQEFDRRRVALEHDPNSYLHPATIVASGAAVYGHQMLQSPDNASVLVRGAIPETISFTSRLSPAHAKVAIFEGIPAGTPTPARMIRLFGLNVDGKSLPDGGCTLPIEVFEGASHTPIGAYRLTFEKPLRHDDDIEIALEFATNGRFSMKVRYGEEFREARLTEAECILDQTALQTRRALLANMELEA